MSGHVRRPILVMAMSAIMVAAMVVPATAADDDGKEFAQGAFHSLATGGAVIAFGAASSADPAAEEHWNSVRIFGYGGGPSQGQVYCGDVWNVIVTVNIASPLADRAFVDETFATHTLDRVLVGATHETAVRWSSTLGTLTQSHGTFLSPGTLADGWHVVRQTLEHPEFGILWAPRPLRFKVDDSAC